MKSALPESALVYAQLQTSLPFSKLFVQARCLARCNGASCELVHFCDICESSFREIIEHYCRSADTYIIASYTRRALKQTGTIADVSAV